MLQKDMIVIFCLPVETVLNIRTVLATHRPAPSDQQPEAIMKLLFLTSRITTVRRKYAVTFLLIFCLLRDDVAFQILAPHHRI